VRGLTVLLKKKADGSAALSCRRDDGSVTWQRQDGAQGRFFPGLRETDLDRIRERRGRLFGQWAALGPGETLELTFQMPSRHAAAPIP